jgi:folate-dependent phosphoribosylglycinamide formyltransferase PurN
MTERLRVVVLTCSDLGGETAQILANLNAVERVTVIRAPQPRAKTLRRRLVLTLKRHGGVGLARLATRKLVIWRRTNRPAPRAAPHPRVDHLEVMRFETPEGLEAISSCRPDLAVVDGTYILSQSVFELPRLGSINLHCGYLPDYKGAPPAFWELLEGTPEVGVTIHFVTADLDGGPIISRRKFPLDICPEGDPMEYIATVWSATLRPAGIAMIGAAIEQAHKTGSIAAIPQNPAFGVMHRSPNHTQIRELRRVVRERRRRQ